MKWNDTAEGRNLEVKRDQKRTSERMPPILGGGGEMMCVILLKCSEKNKRREKFASNKFFCLNETVSYAKILNFMKVMELKILYLFRANVSGGESARHDRHWRKE
jgi:hypothetical protein